MIGFLDSYAPILVFIFIVSVLSISILAFPFVFSHRSYDKEKLSTYECGFDPFENSRMRFDVRFCLVSILFIIFDLEIAFLFPWAICFKKIGWFGFWSMMVFLGILTIGFIYEWKKGALEWD
ncbi:NADH-quinone oxidoreductase subunit A [Candidatus Liberibacter americanus]|uniref:NADH-quinone oxidoreductase subunit A n=1 Tax=Candidatus Liberibacter americanus str. Sao Paulo TaxID=1261131 RepID=U6B4T8_9HYPH|nr:NADH-quinone oxidoreductase subunit A [Candidatus Liberibacter americanus]AHA27910.1 NADH ubiquinone oxidoreductase chain A [Candidatus Liberibacter americanus str. Sao Paulo]EMS36091.1 NADH dehydrogenase subunit A [Candidatus Liberibacter americanus PW_SP]